MEVAGKENEEVLKELNELSMSNKLHGIFHNIPNEVYHHKDCPGLSKSGLDLIRKSLNHYYCRESKDSKALVFGSAAHTLLLEPHNFESEFIVAPNVNKRTNAGKEEWNEFIKEANGKKVLESSDMETLNRMKESFDKNKIISQLLNDVNIESSCFWTDPKTRVLCKCRPDAYRDDGIIIDLKTTEDASRQSFRKSIVNFNYDKQAAYYLDGLNCIENKFRHFVFIAIEKSPPFGLAIYELDEQSIETGRALYKEDLHKYMVDKRENSFSYPEEIQKINIPAYGFNTESR